MARYFQMPPRRGHTAARAPLQPLTPTDYATTAQTLTAAAQALTAAADQWQAALSAGDRVAVMRAKLDGQGAAIDATRALARLSNLGSAREE